MGICFKILPSCESRTWECWAWKKGQCFPELAIDPFFMLCQWWWSSFSNFSCMFLNPNNFSNSNSNCYNLLDMRNLQEQVKKAFCYQKLFWPVWINCSNDLKIFANFWPSAPNFKSFSRWLEHFFLTVVQNNFGNKILAKIWKKNSVLIYRHSQYCQNFQVYIKGWNPH